MKYLLINDEHELYKIMFADLINSDKYCVTEINRLIDLGFLGRTLSKVYFSEKINRHIRLPFRNKWNKFYCLNDFPFDSNEQYWIIFLNGSLRCFFTPEFLASVKFNHPNVKFALLMYDSISNPASNAVFDYLSIFDRVFSFDSHDCEKMGWIHFYSTFSIPNNLSFDQHYYSKAFFIGVGDSRLSLMTSTFDAIAPRVKDCDFRIVGVHRSKQVQSPNYSYSNSISYRQVLNYSFNTDCIIEIVKPGQTGITLRTCEAIAFNKKLLTNNQEIINMPFYNEQYMSVFSSIDDIDYDFITRDINVDYCYSNEFSPNKIIELLED